MWWNDPFKLFLRIYGALIIIGLCILLLTRQELNNWFFDNMAYRLMESEADYIEELWYSGGEAKAKAEIERQHDYLFHYELHEIINYSELEKMGQEWLAELDGGEADDPRIVKEDNSEPTLIIYLPIDEGNRWQSLHISINLEYFSTLFLTINLLMVNVGAVLLIGLAIAWFMIHYLKGRLTEINLASEKIHLTNNLSERVPQGRLTGPLAETIAQINQMLTGIESSVTATKQQANNIAHDLRTPITSVYNKIQRLAEQYPELAEVELSLEKQLATFNTLLRINRLESNGETVANQQTRIADILLDVKELYEPVLEEKQQSLCVSVEEGDLAMVNPELLFQVLCNLIDNSSKYSPTGSLIELSTHQVAGTLCISVQDQSGGVEEQNLAKLSEKFYREDQSRHQQGDGLGLSFVAAAVEKMAGEMELSNQSLEGKRGLGISMRFNTGSS